MSEPNQSDPPPAEEQPPRLLDQAGDVDLSSLIGTDEDPLAEQRAEALRRLRTLGYL